VQYLPSVLLPAVARKNPQPRLPARQPLPKPLQLKQLLRPQKWRPLQMQPQQQVMQPQQQQARPWMVRPQLPVMPPPLRVRRLIPPLPLPAMR
jgi:hypothetical protein